VKNIPIIHLEDLPNMATHCDQKTCGFTVYKGVLVQWDEDEDQRILLFIDNLPANIRKELAIAQEHEAALALRWKHHIPTGYEEYVNFEVGKKRNGYDVWFVSSSEILRSSKPYLVTNQ